MHSKTFLLEKLLTSTPAARPPGAARAVARLPHPAVSVILPTFNRADYVGEAIESVLAQSFKSWELIVVDDGSSDDTAEAVAPYLEDARVRYIRQENAGASAARNRGLAETSAPLVCYLDSDNTYYPDFLTKAVDILATEPDTDMVYGALVSESHGLVDGCILLEPYDRVRLLQANFMDTGVIMHRRSLVDRFGNWDVNLKRLNDWDLVLRYSAERPARMLPALACNYRICDDLRITDKNAFAPEFVAIQRKHFPATKPARQPRILYAVWHYPQLSETYIETELQCLLRWGVHIEVWREGIGPSPYPINVPVHDGTLSEAIAAMRPDVIHLHWIGFAHAQAAVLENADLPVTLRLHGFDTTREGLTQWLAHDWAKAVYAYPGQISRLGIKDARLRAVPVAFAAETFAAQSDKDPRLVVRTAAALPAKDLEMFLEVAKRLPEHRFVLTLVTCQGREDYGEYMKRAKEALQSPVELRFNVPREEIVALVGRAGIYIHTMHPEGASATPVGEPISVAEAMATGCYCLVRDVPELAQLVAGAGATYCDADDLVAQLQATLGWGRLEWRQAWFAAVERAFSNHADSQVLRPVYQDWVHLAAGGDITEARQQTAAAHNLGQEATTHAEPPGADNGSAQDHSDPSSAIAHVIAARRQKRQDLDCLRAKLVDTVRHRLDCLDTTDGALGRLCRAHPEPALILALLYQIVLGRGADAQGMLHYLGAAASGRPLKRIAADLVQSDEYASFRLGKDWWRTACRNVGEPDLEPWAFQSPASFCYGLARRLLSAG